MVSRFMIRISAITSLFSSVSIQEIFRDHQEASPTESTKEKDEPSGISEVSPAPAIPELHHQPGITGQVHSWYVRALDFFCASTPGGLLNTGVLIFIALVSSFVALFIDLDLLPAIAVSLLACQTLVGSGIVLKIRCERRSWWSAPGTMAGPGDAGGNLTAPAPADPVLPPRVPDQVPVPDYGSDDQSSSELEWYWVEEPFSYVKIRRNGPDGYVYTIYEPPITAMEKTILQETYARLRDIIVFDTTEADMKNHFEDRAIQSIIREFDPLIPPERLKILMYYLRRDLSGYGALEVLMRDPALEDLSCNGWDLPVFIFHKVYGSLPSNVSFREGELNQFVLKLAQKANKQISLSNPMVDATLPDGARVQITYSDIVSTKGSSFTIRKFRADPMTPLDLIRLGTYSPRTLAFLWLAIEHRKSLLVVGGTASGKTSTMNAVSLFIPQNAKIVSLEDTREIQLPHKNWLPTQTRELTNEGIKGDIDLFSLLKACMRQRPEFIIVGEGRGREAQTLFQAMNTGHATLSTIHAGTVNEAINRLTHDPINVPPVMFQALDLVVVQSIYTLGKRRIRRNMSIHEIEVDKQGEVRPIPLFRWDIHSDTFQQLAQKSRVLEEIAAHCGWSNDELEAELSKREMFFARALQERNLSIRDLANGIHDIGD